MVISASICSPAMITPVGGGQMQGHKARGRIFHLWVFLFFFFLCFDLLIYSFIPLIYILTVGDLSEGDAALLLMYSCNQWKLLSLFPFEKKKVFWHPANWLVTEKCPFCHSHSAPSGSGLDCWTQGCLPSNLDVSPLVLRELAGLLACSGWSEEGAAEL